MIAVLQQKAANLAAEEREALMDLCDLDPGGDDREKLWRIFRTNSLNDGIYLTIARFNHADLDDGDDNLDDDDDNLDDDDDNLDDADDPYTI